MRIANHAGVVLLWTIATVWVSSASAQTPSAAEGGPRAEVAFTYNLVRANAPPGGCGCFLMNGGSGSFAYRVTSSLSLVAEGGAVISNSAPSGRNLTLATYFDGARYSSHRSKRIAPFGQVLFGFIHAYGSLAPDRLGLDSSTAFAMSAGGGIDLNLSHHLAWRAAQADYLLTLLPNRSTDSQNNFRFQSGIVIHFGGK
jgi:outer membrane immunogenic protein